MLIIRELRKKSGESQKELADSLGVSLRTIQNWEGGSVDVPTKKLEAIANHFDVSVAFLVSNKNSSLGENFSESVSYIGKNKTIAIDDFLDIFFKYKENVEKHPRFQEYLSGIRKDAIIEYQHELLTKAKKANNV